ncbi:YD repeat-containing protein [Flavobacterium cauense R2A-7]|uniref:YD repeat-containing protein n=2 Tax=Flavobacterium TaxID=237 RepID=A0A562M3W1_9FLAO|nr:hypothetical protein [Flavobacterium cauense]KGO84030.1 hypothetical protein Q762_01970 [Flavobacterium cauense R2A-7]TWI14627.1 YD repeat-containing protein [Flavobacterium cauense R2A-7]
MKKLIYAFSALTLLFASCSSDSDSSTDDTSSTGLLTKVVETYGDGSVETITFTYSGNKIVKNTLSIDGTITEETTYTYTGDLITEEKYYIDGNLDETITYEYDANSKLIGTTRHGEFVHEEDVLTYNANGTVSFVTTSGSETIATGTIYFNGNQPFKKVITREPGGEFEFTTTEVTTFDTKNNPFKNIIGFAKIEIGLPSYTEGYPGLLNNPMGYSEDSVEKESFTYTYNSGNYPVTEVYDDFGNDDNDFTAQYFYE